MNTQETKLGRSLTAIGLYFLFVPAAFAQSPMYDKEVLDLFAQYPKSNGLDYVAYSHAGRERWSKWHFVLYSTWFLHGDPNVAMVTKMTAEGEVYTVRRVFDWADQAGIRSRLTTDDLKLLLAVIKELPKEAESPPLEFLVVVSFQQDGKWITRLYDSRKPPPELTRIYKFAGLTMGSS